MIAVLSDIHGNLPALDAVLSDMPDVSAVWVLGDTVGDLPFSCQVLDRLQALPGLAHVAGNREISMLEAKAGGHADWWQGTQFRTLAWTADQLASRHWALLGGMPTAFPVESVQGHALLFHGTPDRVRGMIRSRADAEAAAHLIPKKWLCGGHTHESRVFCLGAQIVLNAGSVGISLDGLEGMACYALIDEKSRMVSFRHVQYDVEKVSRAMRQHGFEEMAPGISRAILKELHTGRHHLIGLVEFCYAYARRELGSRVESIPPEVWAEAEKAWDGEAWRPQRA